MGKVADRVRAAKKPQDALLVIAEALDELLGREADSGWGEWDAAPGGGWGDATENPDFEEAHRRAVEAMNNSGPIDVVLPPPTPEKMDRRRMFERQRLKLATVLTNEVEPDDGWTEIYAKGGPLWLYANNRELVMTYDEDTRRTMVKDLLEDDPDAAHQMSIDVLKRETGDTDFESGAGALAVGDIGTKKS